ncbi:MAG: hypothetical protein RL701_6511 [Pseudomonadota bacterium]|jgi:hypothetical protein
MELHCDESRHCTHFPSRHLDVLPLHGAAVLPCPLALQVSTALSDWQTAPLGTQSKQVRVAESHMASHLSVRAIAEPSALQVWSEPSAAQDFSFGLQTLSVQSPAACLHSSGDAQILASMNWPTASHCLSVAP